MFETLLDSHLAPFTLSLALLFGLLGLELFFALLGMSLLGMGADADLDLPDMEAPDLGDIDISLEGTGFDAGDIELAEFEPELSQATPTTGPLSWLGLGEMPALIWVAALLMAFGLTGLVIQTAFDGVVGSFAPAILVAAPALAAGLWFARSFGALFARLLPKTESEALSSAHLGRRRGIVSQGTATRGRPAEVRVTDRFGNAHHLRAEPLRDEDILPQGSEVLVLRNRKSGGYLLVGLTD